MIYTRFHGRTGNQMFQYAAGRALALRLGTSLAIDDRYALHRGEKSLTRVFSLATETPMDLPPAQHSAKLRYHLWRAFGRTPRFYREPSLGFDPTVLALPDNSYLHGYWQSEKYFTDHADAIRSDFTFPAPSGQNADLAAQIGETLSVSLHVRRGDYVSNASHVVCAQPYYDAALAALLPQLEAAPQIFVFSDDPDWARNNLKLPGTPIVIDHNGDAQDYEDMRLMSLCRHNIIANSSFSWWGAWLNQNPQRTVIAPKRWFGKDALSNPDIWAVGWTKV
ncbi:alpha-1,2-fucosyltransferase [Cognatishimia sp. SS12]|uniref:alpha-1,2-fucosyltransferase n=1 Tax=Cognatishimia sp. SS12 TaxID=2979465 RepID=UPI00232BA05C|nr:alpha-1,2-fucosyltransferase [Cognatishimia sp. SS12]MDC0737948.1 alpha-1,2-fucosyltransferase [Cognatishimia sp. SS12]